MNNLFYIIMILELFSIFFIGAFVYFKGKNRALKYFIFFILAAECWLLANFLLAIFNDSIYTIYLLRSTYAVAILMGIALLIFVKNFPNQLTSKNSFLDHLITILLVLISLVSLTHLVISSAVMTQIITNINYGKLYLLFPASIIFLIIKIFTNLWQQYKLSKGIAKLQARYTFIGIIVFVIFASTTDVFIPLFTGLKVTGNFGQFGLIFVIIAFAYAILAHRLFDIRVIIKRTVVYTVLLVFVLVTYALVVMSLSVIFSGQLIILGPNGIMSARMFIPNLIAAVLIAIGFDPLKNWLSDFTDRWLFKGEYNSQEVLKKLSENLTTVIDLDEALLSMMKTIIASMRVKNAASFILKKNTDKKTKVEDYEVKRVKTIGYHGDEKKMVEQVHPLIHYYLSRFFTVGKKINLDLPIAILAQKTIATEELERLLETGSTRTGQEILESLKSLKAALVMPLETKEKLIGIFILGEKLSGDTFNQKDFDLLDITTKQTTAAVEKARFYEEDQLKSEFVNIASHELLTPTSAIEGYLSMILDEKLAKVDKKAEGYLRKVFDSSRRLQKLVKDLLSVSRIEGGRIVIQWQAFNLVELIKSVNEEIAPKAQEKKIEFKFSNGLLSQQIIVFADKERVRQVLINLLGNAIKYSQEKTPVIYTVKIDKNEVRVSVSDQGIGIAHEDQKHLFEKFFRTNTGIEFGAAGTGLGLYITKNIVELMQGKIWVESTLGKGSTFYFTLKVATSQQIKEYSKIPEGLAYISSTQSMKK